MNRSATLLEEPQRTHLEVRLRVLEERLDAAQWDIERSGRAGIFRAILFDLTADERRAVLDGMAALRRLLRVFADRFELGCETRSLRRALVARFAILSTEAYDLRSEKLRGYGPLNPRLAAFLDPLVEELCHDLDRLRDVLGGPRS
jgi:hypothetical protein